jgi:hypothetical protein
MGRDIEEPPRNISDEAIMATNGAPRIQTGINHPEFDMTISFQIQAHT